MTRPLASLLLLPGALGPIWSQAPGAVPELRIEGADAADARLIRAAFGLRPDRPLDAAALDRGLAAVRRVDRFLRVEGALDGGAARIRVVPLPPLARLTFSSPLPPTATRALFPGLRKGVRAGDLRLQAWQSAAVQRLQDTGYPAATAKLLRSPGGEALAVEVIPGPPALIREVAVVAPIRPYAAAKLQKWAGLRAGRSLWSAALERNAVQALRERFLKDRRYEGWARLSYDPGTGVATLEVQPGPKVKLRAEGARVGGLLGGQGRLAELVLFARAAQWSPSLLPEGERHLVRHFREQGYRDVKVTHERNLLSGTAEAPEEVEVVYRIDRGPSYGLQEIRFTGQQDVDEADLRAATRAGLQRLFRLNAATPELVRTLEDRVRNLYLARGYADARVRGRLAPVAPGRVDLTLEIREGRARHLRALEMTIAPQPGLEPARLWPALGLWLADRPARKSGPEGTSRWPADRAHLQGVTGQLSASLAPDGAHLYRMVVPRAIPFVKGDLGMVLADLRQRLAGLGSPRPELSFTEVADQEVARIHVPPQALEPLRRLVVRGLDRTRPEAVLREFPAPPAPALDPAALDGGLSGLSSLGAFARTDLQSLAELPGEEEKGWGRGDLELRTEERNPWTFSEGFGYDRAQGYRFLFGVQRANLGGMGRSLDLGIRAGDQTLRSKPLREAFPTGDVNRSLDSYSLGYTDPWFLPGSLDRLLHTRTRLRLEGAYLEEANAGFFARRRRFLGDLEWRLTAVQTAQIGYRFERAEVASAKDPTTGEPLFNGEELFALARSPERSVISSVHGALTVDRRDRLADPTSGTMFSAYLEVAPQALGTSTNSSFAKLDLRHQWNWPVGFRAEAGVLSLNLRLGVARPTASTARDLPLTERFFGGGPFSVRGVEPGFLGPVQELPKRDRSGAKIPIPGQPGAYETQLTPLGGQILSVANLEYRFPLPWIGNTIWGEIFVDAGQVYAQVNPANRYVTVVDPSNPSAPPQVVDTGAPFPAWRITPGLGLILKMGFPIRVEYATDWRRILGRPRSQTDRDTQLRNLLISAGFQF